MNRIHINILAIIACLLWASAFAAGKFSLIYIPPVTLAGIRLLLSALMLSLFVKKDELKKLLPYWKTVVLYSVLKIAIPFTAFNLGLVRVSGSLGAMIVGSSPAIAILTAVAFIESEHLTKDKVISMSLGMIAIIMLSLSKSSDGANQIIGVVMLLINCICASLSDIYIKKQTQIKFSITLNFIQILIGAIIVTAIGLLSEDFSFSVFVGKASLFFDLLYLAFITAGATTIWLKLVQTPNVELSVISIWKLLIPSIGALISWIITTGDNPTIKSVFALVLILISIFIATRRQGKSKRKVLVKAT
jgi:drug/metabolite transporter (DMT)-like permease